MLPVIILGEDRGYGTPEPQVVTHALDRYTCCLSRDRTGIQDTAIVARASYVLRC